MCTWNRSWSLGNVASITLISCFNTFRQAMVDVSLSVVDIITITCDLHTDDGSWLTPRSDGLCCLCRPVGHGPCPVEDDEGRIARGERRTNGNGRRTTTTACGTTTRCTCAFYRLRSAVMHELLSPLRDETHVGRTMLQCGR